MGKTVVRAGCVLVAVVALLAGCGGGGDAAATVRAPLPTLVQDILPPGERLDLRERQYFPLQAGNTWTYDVARDGRTTARGATLTVTSANGDDAWLTDTVLGESSTGQWRRTAAGIVSVATIGGTAPAAAAAVVGDLLEYPEPFYPIGAERQSIRQGSWGADLDGDGHAESFRLEITHMLVGFEAVALPRGTAEAAHFCTTMRLTVSPSRVTNAPVSVQSTEESWWAPALGRVRMDYSAVADDGTIATPRTSLRIAEATVGGVVLRLALPTMQEVYRTRLPHRRSGASSWPKTSRCRPPTPMWWRCRCAVSGCRRATAVWR